MTTFLALIQVLIMFIMIWIVPSFIKVFDDFGAPLPETTVFFIHVSNAFVRFWYLLPVVVVLICSLYLLCLNYCTNGWMILINLLLFICLGGVVGFIIFAMFFPLINVDMYLSA